MPNTREKLIELVDDYTEPLSVRDIHKADFAEKFADHLIANGITFAEDNNVPSKWIPVTERLPEDDLPKDTKKKMIRCLVYTDKGTIKPCVRQRWEHFDGQLVPWQWNKDLYAKPTHWMYYPQPPKGE